VAARVLSIFRVDNQLLEGYAMTKVRSIWAIDLSRRCLLQRTVCAAGAAAILGAGVNAAMAGKMPKAAVAYQGSPKDGKSCANCRLFQAPSSCKSVDGAVSANGWCRIWFKA
jgi:High potential iron-sulfur protein